MMFLRQRASLAIATLAVSIGACERGGGTSPPNGELADTLRQLISEAYDFSKPGVVDRMAGLYAADGKLVSASGGAMVTDRDSIVSGIARFWENVGQNMQNPEWKWGDVFVESLGENAAVLTASWSIPHTAPNGQPHVISGVWTAAFKRRAEGWRIVQEHLSAK